MDLGCLPNSLTLSAPPQSENDAANTLKLELKNIYWTFHLKLWSGRTDEFYEHCKGHLKMKAVNAKAERRIAARKVVDFIHVAELTSLSSYSVIAREGVIIDASQSGFLLRIDRAQLIPKEYRDNLSMTNLVGHQVVMFLPQMNLDLDGTITRAEHVGKGTFEIACIFSPDVPEYWRDCLVELLPAPGEIRNEEEEEAP